MLSIDYYILTCYLTSTMLNPYQKKHIKIKVTDSGRLAKANEFPIENMCPIDFKKTGKVLMGRCIFHEEDSPSLAIYTETNSYHCFGCGASGDAISFYQRVHNCSFTEALEALAG